MDKPRLFLSYSNLDKKLAGSLKLGLSQSGFDVFLAHEDITPSDEWLKRIELELKRCRVFIALLSTNFRKSEWTDHEVGFALSRSKGKSKNRCLVMSLVVPPMTLSPHGFLRQFQGLKLDPTAIESTCDSVADIIVKKLGLADFKKDHVISQLASSPNFKMAKKYLGELYGLRPFSFDQSKRIAQAAIGNTQIYWPPENHPVVRILVGDHFDALDKKTKAALLNLSDR